MRPEARGSTVFHKCVCDCVSFQAHTVPVTAHWWPAQRGDEAGRRARVQEGARRGERRIRVAVYTSASPIDKSQTLWSWLVWVLMFLKSPLKPGRQTVCHGRSSKRLLHWLHLGRQYCTLLWLPSSSLKVVLERSIVYVLFHVFNV